MAWPHTPQRGPVSSQHHRSGDPVIASVMVLRTARGKSGFRGNLKFWQENQQLILKNRAEVSTIHPLHFCHSKSLKWYGPPVRSAFVGPDLDCPETNVAFDSEDGRLGSRKQSFTDSTRKVGLETWGSDSVPDHSKGSLAPVKERGT
jgi:hypothetical protein